MSAKSCQRQVRVSSDEKQWRGLISNNQIIPFEKQHKNTTKSLEITA